MSQQCSTCQHVSPDAAKFCPECGTPLLRTCDRCGHPSGGGKFCMECGAPVQSSAPSGPAVPAPLDPRAAHQPVSERRTTTVLFADLVAFTSYSEGRDPEEVRELLSAYFARARTVVSRYGGTIEKFIGDAVMAVWGVPVSHEDDAERAVRAGLDLVSEVAALGESAGAPGLSMRIGIVTGSVAVTLGATNEGMVAGDAVNTAARVQTAATPGSVWVDAETRSLTQAAIAFSDMGEHAMKGKAEPVRLFQVEAVVAARGGAQRVDGLEAPLAGRDAELRVVKEALHATQADGRARSVLVTGVAGIGKSRLGWEFEKHVDGLSGGVFWHRGRSLSYGDGVAFWAFAEMVRSRLKILEGDERPEVEAKIRVGAERVARDAAEAAWLVPRVGALVSGGDRTVSFDRTDLFAAWTTFLERVGGTEPVVLLFEDTQYADNGLLDLIEHLLRAIRCPLVVLVLARPELLEKRAGLASGGGTTHIELAPLGHQAMRTLVDGLVADLPERARAALVARAEGVPLYAVETVRSLIDQDAVLARDGRYVFVDHDHSIVDLDRLTAPTSLHTLIAARLDALTPVERRSLQDASVLGLTFRYASLLALSEVSSYELDEALAALVAKGLFETQSDPRSPELGQYRFLQAMVREVAYSTLARSDRRSRHLAAAAQLERDGAEDLSGIIAQHLLDALAASGDQDPERASMAERARTLLTTAAARAEALGSPEEALVSALSALELDPEPHERTGLLERAARVATVAGHAEQGEELAGRAAADYRRAGDQAGVARALVVQTRALMDQGRTRESSEVAQVGNEMARAGHPVDPASHIELLAMMAWAARVRGDTDAQLQHAIHAMLRAEESQDPAWVARALNTLATVLVDLGMRTANLALIERAITMARDQHLLEQLGRSLTNQCANLYQDDLAAARGLTGEIVDVNRQLGDLAALEIAMINTCIVWWLSGEWPRVLEETHAWVDIEPSAAASPLWLLRALVRLARGEVLEEVDLPGSEEPYFQHSAQVVRALTLDSAGDARGAATMVADSCRRTFAAGSLAEDFEILWAPSVELQLQVGDLDTAAELLALADELGRTREFALTRGVVPRLRGLLSLARGEDPEADLREAEAAFAAYGAPYLLARTRLELAGWLTTQGRSNEASPLLAQARATFVDLGAAPSVAEVDALSPVGEPVRA